MTYAIQDTTRFGGAHRRAGAIALAAVLFAVLPMDGGDMAEAKPAP